MRKPCLMVNDMVLVVMVLSSWMIWTPMKEPPQPLPVLPSAENSRPLLTAKQTRL